MTYKEECIRPLIIRSPTGQSPVDFNVNLQLHEPGYDKVTIQLLGVCIDEIATSEFPIGEPRHRTLFVESNMGQMLFDTGHKRSFLGVCNVCKENIRPMHFDEVRQPVIELASIPNGIFNFSLRDVDGVLPDITDDAGNPPAIQGLTLVFQLVFSKSLTKKTQYML